jgi:methionine--tRNA ligase beta chain|tara:strand:- start:99 stop:425 length:327 start_codon:yes stop_codon:yes gene_type:complete
LNIIGFDEFSKLEIKVGTIKKAENVPGASKLVKLIVNLGNEERQIVAGLAPHYSLDELINKEIVVLSNLTPKKMFGLESQGMLLAAIDGDKVALLKPDKEVKPGAPVG